MVEYVELKDIGKDKRKAKTKKFFKTIGKGASSIGSRVAKGTGTLIQKAKEAQSPEAQERRLAAQEQKLVVQERMAKRRARIAKLQPKGGGMFGGGGGGGFGFQQLDMGNVLTGEQPKKRKGKPFDPFSQF